MTISTVADWSTTAASNVDVGGVGIQGSSSLANGDDAIRTLMSHIASWRTAATIGGYFGQTVIGHTAALSIGGNSDNFEVFGTTAATGGLAIGMFSATPATSGHLDFYKSANASIGSATVVASGEALGAVNAYGAQQTGTFATQTMAAQVRFEVDGTVTSGGSGDMPGRIVFATTADSGSAVTDRLILDSSGNLKPSTNGGVALGTSSLNFGVAYMSGAIPVTMTYVDAGAALGPTIDIYRDSASPAASDSLGTIDFNGRDGAGNKQLYARLSASIQTATSTVEDGVLALQTVAAGTLTTQMQFNSTTAYIAGTTRIGQNSTDSPGVSNSTVGAGITTAGNASISSSAQPLSLNVTSDGILGVWRSGGTSQGTMSVSGATITYGTFNGSHEAQLVDDASRAALLVGTILESVDEQSNWHEAPDRVLPKVKISDKPGSKRVYGVFFDWYASDPDEDTLNSSSLGAYVIRIAAGETVRGGDLIESNGDGCGRVMRDHSLSGIEVQQRLVAKITSNVVAEIYPDGSYLVPCTLHCG